MKELWVAVVLAIVAAPVASDTKLGNGVTLKEPTPIKALLERPQDYVGKTVRIDGVATAICEHMGCWMAVAAEGSDASEPRQTVRLKLEDGVIVFPMSAKGRQVSAEGAFELLTSKAADPDATSAAAEHAAQDKNASKQYHIKATGAIIR
jgi:hypothetical protein